MKRPPATTLLSRRVIIYSAAILAILLFVYTANHRLAHAQGGAEITVINSSGWDIYHLYLSPARYDKWGPDQLKQVIKKGERFLLRGIPCNKYDVKIVNEDGGSCVIGSVPLCQDANQLELTNSCRQGDD